MYLAQGHNPALIWFKSKTSWLESYIPMLVPKAPVASKTDNKIMPVNIKKRKNKKQKNFLFTV